MAKILPFTMFLSMHPLDHVGSNSKDSIARCFSYASNNTFLCCLNLTYLTHLLEAIVVLNQTKIIASSSATSASRLNMFDIFN